MKMSPVVPLRGAPSGGTVNDQSILMSIESPGSNGRGGARRMRVWLIMYDDDVVSERRSVWPDASTRKISMPPVIGTSLFRIAFGAKRFWFRCSHRTGSVSGERL